MLKSVDWLFVCDGHDSGPNSFWVRSCLRYAEYRCDDRFKHSHRANETRNERSNIVNLAI